MYRTSEQEFPGIDEDDPIANAVANQTYSQTYTDEQGQKWGFHTEKQAWFPLLDVDIVQKYHEAFGSVEASAIPGIPPAAPKEQVNSRKRKKEQKTHDPTPANANTSIYVTGLPNDITVDELDQYFTKWGGVIKRDPETAELKVKIYKDKDDKPKGDALITYFLRDSVPQAVKFCDGVEIRPGVPLKVTEASFEHKEAQQKGNKKKKGGKGGKGGKKGQNKKQKIDQSKQLGWEEGETRRHIVLFNCFDPLDSKGDPTFFSELKTDMMIELNKLGQVESCKIFENNPQGVVAVKFKTPTAAEKCMQVMEGRFFGGKKLKVEWYDGVTNYYVRESKELKEMAEKNWADWLDADNDDDDSKENKDDSNDKQTKDNSAKSSKKVDKEAATPPPTP